MRGLIYAVAALPAITAFKISKDGRCGANFGLTCKGSQYGNCCSQYNYCGRSPDYCSPQKGCQPGFGDCSGTAPAPSPPHPVPSKAAKDGTCEVSKDGTCGGSKGYTCKNSRFGDCCRYVFNPASPPSSRGSDYSRSPRTICPNPYLICRQSSWPLRLQQGLLRNWL